MVCAVDVAVELGAIRVVMETDSEILALALNPRGPDFSQMAASLDELKIQLRAWFSDCKMQACRRSPDSVAHKLAKVAKKCNVHEFVSWDTDVAASIAELMSGDLPKFS
jgi:hypothetical protein